MAASFQQVESHHGDAGVGRPGDKIAMSVVMMLMVVIPVRVVIVVLVEMVTMVKRTATVK